MVEFNQTKTTMKAEDKAKELVDKFFDLSITIHIKPRTYKIGGLIKDDAKKCALICVDDKIEMLNDMKNNPDANDWEIEGIEMQINYQETVKKEIEKL